MERMITTVISRFKLFRQPHKIGDTIEVDGRPLLILGIEDFHIRYTRIDVHYTCQRLDILDFVSRAKAYKEPFTVGLEVDFPPTKWDKVDQIRMGTTHYVRGECYKITEYTEISLKGTDLHIDLVARPVYPIDRKEARAKLFSDRRKRLQLEIL
ncbi:hypothetical protein GNQ08_20485 [Paenibacillus macerans]|uniref:Uncharacterized protein n=1 Tax=Paenibacillus macerans TaxID=44252 RepID=A0A6N8EY30_PAEMA|nr:hypothetical protein [Paenibacillus macerans]MUG24749.1 hypothetical protein [Paenibacillus macerans]